MNTGRIVKVDFSGRGVTKGEMLLTIATPAGGVSAGEIQWGYETLDKSDLIARAIRGLKHVGSFHYPTDGGCDPHPLDCSLAGRVAHVFGVGMTRATQLCRTYGEDPNFCNPREEEEITE